jgi:hypothetical protein
MSKSTTPSCHLTTKAGLTFDSFFAKSVPERDVAIKDSHNILIYMGLWAWM